jgi:uncharacterized protein (DUF1800 family)
MSSIVGTVPRLPRTLLNRKTLKVWQNAQKSRIEREEKTNSARVRDWENAQRDRIQREAAEKRAQLKKLFVEKVQEVMNKAKNAKKTLRERLQNRVNARRGHTVLSIHDGKHNSTRKNRR